MTEERWHPEEYKADFRNAIGVLNQFFPALLDKITLNVNDPVMEIGLGSGKWSAAFAILGCTVVGVDNNEGILNNVTNNFSQISKAMTLVKDDVKTLTRIPNKTFQLVFSEGLVEHFLNEEERRLVIANMYRKVRPNGFCLCIVPAQNKADDEIFYENPDQLMKEFHSLGAFQTVEGFELKGQGEKPMRFFGVLAKRGPE